jgi:signal peptidase I
MENQESHWGTHGSIPSDAASPSEPQLVDHAAHADAGAQADGGAHVDTRAHVDTGEHSAADAHHRHAGHPMHASSASPDDDLVAVRAAMDAADRAAGLSSPSASSAETPRDWSRLRAEVTAGLQTLFSAAVYATLIVTFGFQVARVDGLSMAPTLEDQDRLIVNKMVYEIGDPRPGDIVMLYYPLNPEKMFVKRVIASEGDVVRIVDGRVYVNDLPLHDDYVPEEFRSHDDWGPKVIDQGYYFVMGDHRNNSSDSRHWGLVPKKYIVGKVKVRFWPLHDARIF